MNRWLKQRDTKAGNLKFFNSWEKQSKCIFTKDDAPTVYLVTEYNQCYSDLVVAFQIGEKRRTCPVLSRYGSRMANQECNSLIGERTFKNGSLTYEFLWEKMGMTPFTDEELDDMQISKTVRWTNLYVIRHALKELGYGSTK